MESFGIDAKLRDIQNDEIAAEMVNSGTKETDENSPYRVGLAAKHSINFRSCFIAIKQP
jgi:hypothetical protein